MHSRSSKREHAHLSKEVSVLAGLAPNQRGGCAGKQPDLALKIILTLNTAKHCLQICASRNWILDTDLAAKQQTISLLALWLCCGRKASIRQRRKAKQPGQLPANPSPVFSPAIGSRARLSEPRDSALLAQDRSAHSAAPTAWWRPHLAPHLPRCGASPPSTIQILNESSHRCAFRRLRL